MLLASVHVNHANALHALCFRTGAFWAGAFGSPGRERTGRRLKSLLSGKDNASMLPHNLRAHQTFQKANCCSMIRMGHCTTHLHLPLGAHASHAPSNKTCALTNSYAAVTCVHAYIAQGHSSVPSLSDSEPCTPSVSSWNLPHFRQ